MSTSGVRVAIVPENSAVNDGNDNVMNGLGGDDYGVFMNGGNVGYGVDGGGGGGGGSAIGGGGAGGVVGGGVSSGGFFGIPNESQMYTAHTPQPGMNIITNMGNIGGINMNMGMYTSPSIPSTTSPITLASPISPTCSKCGISNNQCNCRDNPVIVIEPGKHYKQLVDTRGGTVKIVGSPQEDYQDNNHFIKSTNTKKKARLRLKMNAARRNGSSTSLVESLKEVVAMSMPTQTSPEEDIDKYTFVPVGNGLYRKQLKSTLSSSHTSTNTHTPLSSVSSIDSDNPNGRKQCKHLKEECCSTGTPAEECLKILTSRLDINPEKSSSSCCGNSNEPVSSASSSHTSTTLNSSSPTSNARDSTRDPPLIIAPMSFDGASFSEMGFTDTTMQSFKSEINIKPEPSLANDEDEELNSLQRILEMQNNDNGESEFYDVYYTASCVIPGQCECGDSCSCAGCPTHDPNYEKGQ